MGAVKGVVGYACELLNLTLEEAMDMTIQELQDAIEQAETGIEEVIEMRIQMEREQGFDVDVDENGPFICLADVKEA